MCRPKALVERCRGFDRRPLLLPPNVVFRPSREDRCRVPPDSDITNKQQLNQHVGKVGRAASLGFTLVVSTENSDPTQALFPSKICANYNLALCRINGRVTY